MSRVFIPATLAMLAQFVADGLLHARNGTAFAVTPALREAYAEGDDEELAEVALGEAALASLRLLAAADVPRLDPMAAADVPRLDPMAAADGPRLRRAVLEAEVPDDTITQRPDLDDAVVRLGQPVTMEQVIAAYVDNAAAEPAVAAALEVIDEADLGDEDAELTVGDAQDHDLAWYGTQELPFLLDLL